uniref:Germin-like protein n=1 Tax=Lactuca sativa TaxID=4236 RepID=A0A9R1X415_LACSA|nr:hypothetical protein LSAT_V11C700357530 [Lactuca sativa]
MACVFIFLALVFSMAMAADHSPLQDFCVADMNAQGTMIISLIFLTFITRKSTSNSVVMVNGFACKNPSSVQANDFSFAGLHMMGNTSNALGSRVTPVFVTQLPGLNTLGISMARIDYAPWGINQPHTHPRATEILTVLEGSLEVGFVTSNPENRHITKVLYKGDVFVFPVNLVHYQRNVGKTNAIAIAALSSQNPGVIPIANVIFGSKPDISTDILAKAFQASDDVISAIQIKF